MKVSRSTWCTSAGFCRLWGKMSWSSLSWSFSMSHGVWRYGVTLWHTSTTPAWCRNSGTSSSAKWGIASSWCPRALSFNPGRPRCAGSVVCLAPSAPTTAMCAASACSAWTTTAHGSGIVWVSGTTSFSCCLSCTAPSPLLLRLPCPCLSLYCVGRCCCVWTRRRATEIAPWRYSTSLHFWYSGCWRSCFLPCCCQCFSRTSPWLRKMSLRSRPTMKTRWRTPSTAAVPWTTLHRCSGLSASTGSSPYLRSGSYQTASRFRGAARMRSVGTTSCPARSLRRSCGASVTAW
mmetsp:Transcript_117262/g.328177  ORF Transcript_117262/g.328177 Transcript_117262/m.328177 type:complete len:290 (+) Transcript_117262:174-1043(+)